MFVIKGILFNFNTGKRMMLIDNDNPALNKIGMFLLSKNGKVIMIAITRKKIKKNICNCGRETLKIVIGHWSLVILFVIRY